MYLQLKITGWPSKAYLVTSVRCRAQVLLESYLSRATLPRCLRRSLQGAVAALSSARWRQTGMLRSHDVLRRTQYVCNRACSHSLAMYCRGSLSQTNLSCASRVDLRRNHACNGLRRSQGTENLYAPVSPAHEPASRVDAQCCFLYS